MFGLRLDMSVDQFIIEYTEYLLGKKEEKFHYLSENFIDYIGGYVYPIIQETASWMAAVASFAFNKVVYPVFASETLFNLIATSSDFLGDFSKVQLACIAVLAFLFFGLNKTIRISRKLKKDLKIYQSMLEHLKWQYDAARPEMKEITDRLEKNRDERIPKTNKRLEEIYSLLDCNSQLQHQLKEEEKFWTPLIMEEVRKLHIYNNHWQNGGESADIKKVRELGRHVDIEIARLWGKIEDLIASKAQKKKAHSNLHFDELEEDHDRQRHNDFVHAHGDRSRAEDKASYENEKDGKTRKEEGDVPWIDGMKFSTLSWAEQVEQAERQELDEHVDVVEDVKDKEEEEALWIDNMKFSTLSWAEQVEEAERQELDEDVDVVEDEKDKEEEAPWIDNMKFSTLSWAEQVEEAERQELDEDVDVVEDEKDKEEEAPWIDNMKFSTLSWAEQVEEAERQELDEDVDVVEDVKDKEEDEAPWNMQFSSLSWAQQVEEAESLGLL